ncbi:MAG: SurA N-terminal domain-containing protein [Alphaproteobacteria bacterium]|nr:SurA N-terminal domain-containing protein [Alphaproteobacteria bacterium]MBP9877830.1 SurA N-terminal domain-containing protein [Alphaproteobacteria bacterium]
MLQIFRNASNTIIVKVLFGLIILSFAGWGLSGVFASSTSNQNLAKVGGQSITPQMLYGQFNKNFQQIQAQSGGKITKDQAIYGGLVTQSLDQLMSMSLLTQAAKRAHINVSEDVAVQKIKTMPVFLDENGKFDPKKLSQILIQNQIPEDAFAKSIQNDIALQMLLASVAPIIEPSKEHLSLAYWLSQETRSIDTFFLSKDSVKSPDDPGDDILQRFLESKSSSYKIPETRDLTYIKIQKKDLLKDIEIPESNLREVYNNNLDKYTIPEKRSINQIVFEDEERADSFLTQLSQGKSFNEAAKTLNVKIANLTHLSKNDVMFPNLRDFIFSSKTGDVSRPLKTSLGWIIAKLENIEPAHIKMYEMVKDDLKNQALEGEMHSTIDNLSKNLDDQIAAGKSLEEISQSEKLSLYRAKSITKNGMILKDKTSVKSDLPKILVDETFKLNPSEESPLFEDENENIFLVRLDAKNDERVSHLDDIRPQVLSDWIAEEKRQILFLQAESIIKKAEEGASYESLAQDSKSILQHIDNIRRMDEKNTNKAVPDALYSELFHYGENEIFKTETPKGFHITKISNIAISKQPSDADLKQFIPAVESELKNDVMSLYREALIQEIGMTRDDVAVQKFIKQMLQ